MRHDDLDRILMGEEVVPSSGFTAAVMDAVRREATAPAPIPFPWKRALPGLAGAGLALALLLFAVCARPGGGGAEPPPPLSQPSLLEAIVQAAMRAGAHWLLLALLLTLVLTSLSMRFAAPRA